MADKNQSTGQDQNQQYMIKMSEETEQGSFSNAVSVHFNRNECIIDFGYNLPGANPPTIKVVSRVNLTHKTAESFLQLLSNALLDFKNKQQGK